jgi:hypothetical protein
MTLIDFIGFKWPFILFSRIFLVIVLSCGQLTVAAQSYFTDLEDSVHVKHWLGIQTLDSTHAFSGKRASLTKQGQPYGIGYEGGFPLELAGQNVWLKIEGQVFSENEGSQALFVVTLTKDDQLKLWQGIHFNTLSENPGQWVSFSDSIKIPANLTRTGQLKSYFWNQKPDHLVWMDDLRLTFSPVETPSYIPVITIGNDINTSEFETLYANEFYQIKYERKAKRIQIHDADGQKLVDEIVLFSNRKSKKHHYESAEQLEFVKKKSLPDATQLIFRLKTRLSKMEVILVCYNKQPEMEVEIEETYRKKQQVFRESFVFNSPQPLAKVFRANRKMDTTDFKSEYWLDQQGIQYGTNASGWWMYHQPKISSLQLNTAENQLWINLDYDQDHPYFRYPLNPDSSDWKLDESASEYKRGSKRYYSFTWNAYKKHPEIPRFMKNPGGFLATFIWTEHADWTNIRSNRASYFGSESIVNAEDAIGGFVKYNIPVTKSVFYANPDSIRNTRVSNGNFTELESSIQSDPEFLDFLTQIHDLGSEICLHTPEQYTTTPNQFKEALVFMQKHFKSASWIDHGNNNGLQNNREDLVCDATIKKSPYYALELWPQHGISYVHNSYYEDMPGVDFWQFDGSMAKPYSGFGDFWPKPNYWKHRTKSNNMIHWPTTSALFVNSDGVWDYFFNEEKLNDFVNQWETKINHSYPAWVDPKKGFWTYDSDSVMVSQPGFDRTLQRMAHLRDEGKLNVSTIETYLDYRTSLDHIVYQVFADGHLELKNNGNHEIKDLAMVTSGDYVLVNGLKPASKLTPEGRVFWFDLPTGEKVNIRILFEK